MENLAVGSGQGEPEAGEPGELPVNADRGAAGRERPAFTAIDAAVEDDQLPGAHAVVDRRRAQPELDPPWTSAESLQHGRVSATQ
jgi:hypothetical protein